MKAGCAEIPPPMGIPATKDGGLPCKSVERGPVYKYSSGRVRNNGACSRLILYLYD